MSATFSERMLLRVVLDAQRAGQPLAEILVAVLWVAAQAGVDPAALRHMLAATREGHARTA